MPRRSPEVLRFVFSLLTVLSLGAAGCHGGGGHEPADPAPVPAPETPPVKEIALIGHSHIDLAWKWTWCEAVTICRNTFSSTLRLLDTYPEFRYAQSSAQAYAWMAEYHPDIFERIKEKITQGQWEIVGGA